jgi:hypothetical protein
MGEGTPVPEKRRQFGPTARAVGEWVLGESIFPTVSQDPRWQGYVLSGDTISTATYAESKR